MNKLLDLILLRVLVRATKLITVHLFNFYIVYSNDAVKMFMFDNKHIIPKV